MIEAPGTDGGATESVRSHAPNRSARDLELGEWEPGVTVSFHDQSDR